MEAATYKTDRNQKVKKARLGILRSRIFWATVLSVLYTAILAFIIYGNLVTWSNT